MGGSEAHHSSVERLNGYRAALKNNGLPLDESLILPGEYNFESGTERTDELFRREPRPTAIFACNDEIAAGALFAARINDVAVPQDLSIAGFEDSPFSRQTWPKLTTAHQPNTSIAECAAGMLIEQVKNARQGIESEEVPENGLRPQLVARDSRGPVPK